MEVSFKGFKNAGVEKVTQYACNLPAIMTGNIPKIDYVALNCELTNSNGRDLDLFESVFKKAANKINKNFLNIVLCMYKAKDGDYLKRAFSINDVIFPVEMKNIPVYQKVVDLLIKITKTKDEDFVVNKGYLESDDFYDSFMCTTKDTEEDVIEAMHAPKSVKTVANMLIETMTEEVDEALSD